MNRRAEVIQVWPLSQEKFDLQTVSNLNDYYVGRINDKINKLKDLTL